MTSVTLLVHKKLITDSTVAFHCVRVVRVLLDSLSEIICNDVRVYPDQHMCHILLYGGESFNNVANRMILQPTVRYIKD